VILRDKLRSTDAAVRAGSLIEGWSTGLGAYAPEAIERQFGVPAATITRIAHESVENAPSVALIGDAATSGTNGLFNALAVNGLNALFDSIGKPGGILFHPERTPTVCKCPLAR
jgi:anaerobic selenocysteine-containing dehydrogenase